MLIGNVGNDPEVRYLETTPAQQGAVPPKVAQFRLATSERYRDRNGESHESTEWHNIVAWRGLADLVEKYARKGTQIYVEGRLRTRSWTDQAGAKHDRTEVVADNIQLLGRRSDNQGGQQDGGYGQQSSGQGGNYGQSGGGQPQGGYSRSNYGTQQRTSSAAPVRQPAVPQPQYPPTAQQPAPVQPEQTGGETVTDDLPF